MPSCMLWVWELNSRMHYMAEMNILVRGSIGKRYMATILISASVCVWALVSFNLRP